MSRLSHGLSPLRASIVFKPSSRIALRTNTTVTTPKQVSSPAIVAAPPPPPPSPSSNIRGTRKPIGGFRGGYSPSSNTSSLCLSTNVQNYRLPSRNVNCRCIWILLPSYDSLHTIHPSEWCNLGSPVFDNGIADLHFQDRLVGEGFQEVGG